MHRCSMLVKHRFWHGSLSTMLSKHIRVHVVYWTYTVLDNPILLPHGWGEKERQVNCFYIYFFLGGDVFIFCPYLLFLTVSNEIVHV